MYSGPPAVHPALLYRQENSRMSSMVRPRGEKWEQRFAFFKEHGAPNAPGFKQALKALPRWSDKLRVNFNVWAFFFGAIALFAFGLWKKAIMWLLIAIALQVLCAEAGVPLIINDDVSLALQVGAAGVHLGEDDGDIAAARALLGPQAIIGASCYDEFERAQRAVAAGASYVAFGAFFPSRSKVTPRRASPELLRQSAALGVPRVAIGGLTPDNSRPVVDAGADLIAVISGVFSEADPVAALEAYRSCFGSV